MSRLYEAVMGLVVADALGVPVEFAPRDSYLVTEMTGYGTYRQLPGTWSDDSSMTLATLESFKRKGCVDPADIMQNFFLWLYEKQFTARDCVFDVGNACRNAIWTYGQGVAPQNCGGTGERDNGNGALMRMLPLGLLLEGTDEAKAAAVRQVAGLTHNHMISHIGCLIYVFVVGELLRGSEKREALSSALERAVRIYGNEPAWQNYVRLPEIETLSREEIKSSGYVVDTLEAALWCLLRTESYRDCALLAVNLGEDTDTVGAVAGGLAGLIYGLDGKTGIPAEWIEVIPRKEWIRELCEGVETIRC